MEHLQCIRAGGFEEGFYRLGSGCVVRDEIRRDQQCHKPWGGLVIRPTHAQRGEQGGGIVEDGIVRENLFPFFSGGCWATERHRIINRQAREVRQVLFCATQ